MAILFSPVLNEQQFTANGIPLAGGLIYTYLAGTTTPVVTYKNSTGTAHTNPIVLDSSGNYPTGTQLWLDSGKVYKFVVQDSTGVTLRTIDDITAINDVITTPDEWVSYTASAVTYISANSFSIVGDKTGLFQPGRRIKAVNTGGTVYGTISASVYSAPNTSITVILDSGSLDSGLSFVYYGILAVTGQSIPNLLDSTTRIVDNIDVSKKLAFELSGVSSSTTRTHTIPNYSGTPAVPADEGTIGAVLISSGSGNQPVWGNPPLVRQTVYAGPVDSNGFSSFGGSTGSTTVTASGTIRFTAAAGQNGNYFGESINPSWTGLSVNGTMWMYLDITPAGVITTGSTTLEPAYRWGGVDITTSNQHVFNIQEMTMKVGNGSVATQVYRVFVGEVTVAGGVVTAITWYALRGQYISADVAVPASATKQNFNHNIGCQYGVEARLELVCQTADAGWVAGEVCQNPLSLYTPGTYMTCTPPVGVDSRLSASVLPGSSANRFVVTNKTNGNPIGPTIANWKMRVSARRNW